MTLWSGRFSGKMDERAWRLNASLAVDQRLADQDVRASIAWAGALLRAGVLSQDEHQAIRAGLETIAQEFAEGRFVFAEGDEDIHTAVERRLGELIGLTAGKLHTGRSRNDQVATDFRLWMLDTLPLIQGAIAELQSTLVAQAEQHLTTLMPGYTHLQRAQPVTLAHWLMSHFWPFQRDRERLTDLRKRVAILPLGSGALAGSGFSIDRAWLAQTLGFNGPAPNSLDAVSDRDFVVEYLFCVAMVGVHLSKLSEQMVIFTTSEFGFFTLADAFSTGSSLMPQKKNPDLFELARGKASALIGLLAGMLTLLKGLPSTYDKDLQEDKALVFQATDILLTVLPALSGALGTITVSPERMRAAIDSAMLAADLADALVRKGVPFREAHGAVGRAVRLAAERGVSLEALLPEEWQACGVSGVEMSEVFDPLRSVERRAAIGGTAPTAVQIQIQEARKLLEGT